MIALTSTWAYKDTVSEREIQSSHLLGVYLSFGAMSDREASYKLGWERGTVSARRNDLMKLGKVCELGKKKDGDTNKTVNIYGVIKETLW